MIDTIIIDKNIKKVNENGTVNTDNIYIQDYYYKYLQACSKGMHIVMTGTAKYIIIRRITEEQYEHVKDNSLKMIDCGDGYYKFITLTIDQMIDIKSENIILVDNVDDYTKFKKITVKDFLKLQKV